MIRRVLIVCVLSVFCLGALVGCTPATGDNLATPASVTTPTE